MEKKKPVWKLWDEFLVDAWEKDGRMFMAARQFLAPHGISEAMLRATDPKDFFAEIGVTSRSPKIRAHLYGMVKGFFSQFFPVPNELLWQGKKPEALRAMRRYRVGEQQMRVDREAKQSKEYTRKTRSSGLPLIPGTNAMSISKGRKSAADWNTVKPPCRQRPTRL